MADTEQLNAKAAEIQEQLTTWAKENRVLGAGETLVFSLRVERGVLVNRDASDTRVLPAEVLTPSPQMRFHYDYVAPAKLSIGKIEELVALFSVRKTRELLMKLLRENQNRPFQTYPPPDTRPNLDTMNKKLIGHPIAGRYYRLVEECFGEVPNHSFWFQLWEVRLREGGGGAPSRKAKLTEQENTR